LTDLVTHPSTSDAEPAIPATNRTSLRRKKERGTYDRAAIDAILDEGFICHVGFSDGGSTYVIPTAYARLGDRLVMHGASANHTLRALASGVPACVTVTLLDGIVFARSAFHHSMNFRSVVLFGEGASVDAVEEKRAAVLAIVDHVAPGRSGESRPPTDAELRSTRVVSFPIAEASAKIRTGGPIDDDEDLGLPLWAGVVPLSLTAAEPVPDPGPAGDLAVPASVRIVAEGRRTSERPG